MVLQRNHAFYGTTLLFPILLLTVLSPMGLVLPGSLHPTLIFLLFLAKFSNVCFILTHFQIILVDSGEKMGFQITVLLTMVVYVQILEETVPVFKTTSDQSYKILVFYLIRK